MIRYLQLFGERCSGTKFVANLLQNNLQNIELTRDFGGKHWFIKSHYPRGRANQSTDFECVRPLSDSADTLFVVVFRDPFDWVRSINARPHHAGNHWNLSLTEFLRKPWKSFETSRVNRHWPERRDKYWFIEEAENILKLRSEKIAHLLKLQDFVENVCFVNYEIIRDNTDLLQKIARSYQIKLKHPTIRVQQKYFGRPGDAVFSPQVYPPISAQDLEFIGSELDWEIENRICYYREDYKG